MPVRCEVADVCLSLGVVVAGAPQASATRVPEGRLTVGRRTQRGAQGDRGEYRAHAREDRSDGRHRGEKVDRRVDVLMT